MTISYNIIEKEANEDNLDLTEDNLDLNKDNLDLNEDIVLALKTNYDLNYTLSYLNNILEFYNLKKTNRKKNMNKQEIIEKIVQYEIDNNNKKIVEKRIKLFSNFIELKNNRFFSKFIIGSL